MKNISLKRFLFATTFILISIITSIAGYLYFAKQQPALAQVAQESPYASPQGIPNPSNYFSTFGEINKATPSWPASWLTAPTTATVEYYFIDKSNTSCTNTANTYGHPDKPRCLPPEGALNPGSFLYFHGGIYTPADSAGQNFDWHGAGTPSNPIWITGNPASHPIFQENAAIGWFGSASYIIFENFDFQPWAGSSTYLGNIQLRPIADSTLIDHIILRNLNMTGRGHSNNLPNTGDVSDGGAITIGPTAATDAIPNSIISYVVVYNVNIANYGYIGSLGVGGDETGVHMGYHTDYLWVLDSIIHNVGADSVAGNHRANNSTMKAEHYFIGRNTMYQNGENCVDLKTINHTVISENICYGPFQDEGGAGFVLHYGASSLPLKDAWVFFNKIYNAGAGVVSTSAENIHIMGNEIYDIHAKDADPVNGAGVGFRGTTGMIDVIDNTIYNTEEGIRANETLPAGTTLNIHGNIMSNRSNAARYDIRIDGGNAYADMNYNQLYYPNSAASFYWNGASRDLSYMKSSASECLQCIEGDPLFESPGVNNFKLQTNSPAINSSLAHSAYATFLNAPPWTIASGLDIHRDKVGTPRPQGYAWDIGAYEYTQASPPLKGDFNSDKKVNDLDFTDFKNAFKSIFNSIFDLNSDSTIDVKDLGVLMNGWLP